MKNGITNNISLITVIKRSFRLFYPYNKRQFYFLVGLIFLTSMIDVISFTSIIPVIYLINDPTPITHNTVLHFLYSFLHFTSNTHFILFLLICLVSFFVFKNVILFFSTYFQNEFVFSIAFHLLERQMNRFYKTDYIHIKNNNSQEYMRYIVIASQDFATNMLLPLLLMLYEMIVIILIVIVLLFYYPMVLLLIIISILPVSYLLIRSTKKRLASISETKGKLELESFRKAYESIAGFSDIKLFSKEAVFTTSVSKQFRILFDIRSAENIYQWFPRRIIETLVIVSVCILYAITSIILGFSEASLVLIMLAFATAAYRLMPCVNEIMVYMVKIKTSQYVLDHLSFLKIPPTEREDQPLSFSLKLTWNEVNYSYPGTSQKVLQGINMIINKGDFIVITGESGSGKTTIGKIMTGFIKHDSGQYLIDGKEVKNFNQIKSLIGYVTQDFYLFDRSLLENIAIGEDPATINIHRINKVIENSNLTELVNSFPTGIHHVIGEMGAWLSGGQRQRIAIARALYKQAEILVLDEITSNLDIENEMEILDTIYSISKKEKLTVILITHRIASVKKYDRVYMLENGKLK